jgi:hypothetical protein
MVVLDNIFEFTPLVENLDLSGGKQLVVPTRSSSMVECFAIDWLIVNLGLDRVGIFSSPTMISPMVQRNAYSEDPSAPLTTAVELFATKNRDMFLLQIRSEILDGKMFAQKFSQFVEMHAQEAKVVILSGSDSCFLTGDELKSQRIGFASGGSQIVNGGLATRFVEVFDEKEVMVASTRGRGAEEIATLSLEMARAVCSKILGVTNDMKIVPCSIRTIV